MTADALERLREMAEHAQHSGSYNMTADVAELILTALVRAGGVERTPELRVADFLRKVGDVSAPSVILEDDGDIGFDWGIGSRVVSAHIGRDGNGGWAALIGDYRSHGKFSLDADFPSEFVDALKRFSDAEARGAVEPPAPCADGHTWTNQFGDDWTPERGAMCDCQKKAWGVEPPAQEPLRELERYMPIEADLLPCPFCGEKAVLTNVRMSDKSFRISCVNELCWRPGTDYYDSKDAVVAFWNRRSARPSPPPATPQEETMKLDAKFYGEIHKAKDGSRVPDDEYVVFLIKDNAFAAVLPDYRVKCIELGCDAEQIAAVDAMIARGMAWRKLHPERLKNPDAAGERLLVPAAPHGADTQE